MLEKQPTSRQSKGFLPQSSTGWIGLALFLALVGYLLYPILFHDRSRIEKTTKEMYQLRTIAIAITTYALDNDGELPAHVMLLHQPDAEYLLSEDAEQFFTSPFNENSERRWVMVDEPIPTDWYMHGSYRFYPLSGLKVDDISDTSEFILAYGPSQGKPPKHAAIFMDGSFQWLTKPELQGHISGQGNLIERE